MKKIIAFILSTVILVAAISGVFLMVRSGGGYHIHSSASIANSGEVRSWTRKDFDKLDPIESWDDGTASQYKKIIAAFGKADDSRISIDKKSSKKPITKMQLNWRQKHEIISLGFYKYTKNGQWILHDKTWTDK